MKKQDQKEIEISQKRELHRTRYIKISMHRGIKIENEIKDR